MLQSQPTKASLESGALEPGPIREQVRQHELARRLSLTIVYELWVGSWETALAALATASQSRTLSTNEAAAHKAVIAAERELVTQEFALLAGADFRPFGDGRIRKERTAGGDGVDQGRPRPEIRVRDQGVHPMSAHAAVDKTRPMSRYLLQHQPRRGHVRSPRTRGIRP